MADTPIISDTINLYTIAAPQIEQPMNVMANTMLTAQCHQAMAGDPTLQAALDNHDCLQNEAEDARMDDEECATEYHRLYGTTAAEIEAAGGNPASGGAHYAQGLICLGGPPCPPINVARGDRLS